MINKIEHQIKGSENLPILIDVSYKKNFYAKKVVVFCHGFKGFKDWGPFNRMADCFAEQDIVFVKFNFSHNGTTIKDPLIFGDLEAFGNNNFCKELDDLGFVLDWLLNTNKLKGEINKSEISLFGHSRGGSIVMLKTSEDIRINKIITWSSPSNILRRLPRDQELEKWKIKNVVYVYNGRTKQNMPMYYQFYENCQRNKDRLKIQDAVCNMSIPHLLVHGSNDQTVLIDDATELVSWNPKIERHVIEGANHVFDAMHPYNLQVFPKYLKEAIDTTISFLKK